MTARWPLTLSLFVTLTATSVVAEAQQAQTPPAPPAATPGPTFAAAETMLATARARAAALGISLSCAVVDIRGDLIAAARMDGAAPLTMVAAQGKARTSALTGLPSGGLGERAAALPALGEAMGQTLLTIQGAVPIVQGGKRVGGIGCSGAPPQQDEEVARAAAAAGQ